MAHHQSRVDRSDGQQRKSGGRPGHNRAAGGAVAVLNHQLPSSSNQPSLSTNRSFNKSVNVQGAQSKVAPAIVGGDTTASAVTTRTLQNGAHGQPPTQGSSAPLVQGGPKQGDRPITRTTQILPKASPHSAPATSDSVAPSTPVKGDTTKPFTLQFGSISPGIVDRLQVPARTSSAPPNLDEQKQNQARNDSFRTVPPLPIPSEHKQLSQPARKDAVGAGQSTGAESLPPVQVKREVHHQISTAPVVPPPKSAALSIPGISMAMPFQQPQIPMQFGGPRPQQMPMALPVGNAPQVPQMFVHNLHAHPMQTPVMIHQGQGLGFGAQINHQLGTQFGNFGIGIPNPQFVQQQQQPGKSGSPRKTPVKITHPETHEEVMLDKRTDLHNDSCSSGQRQPTNATVPVQPIVSYSSSHYFPQLQTNSYNSPPIFFSTSTTGSLPPRFSYPMGQNVHGISFMNPSLVNPIPGTKPLRPLHSELGKPEPPPVTVPLAPIDGLVKPTVGLFGSKVEVSLPTISMPFSEVEESKFLNLCGDVTIGHQQRDNDVSVESFSLKSETFTQLPVTTPLPASTGLSAVATAVISEQRARLDTSAAPAITCESSGSVLVEINDKKRESIWRSDSLKGHQKKSSKKGLRQAPQQMKTAECASGITTSGSSVENSKDGNSEDVEALYDVPMSCFDVNELASTGKIPVEEKCSTEASSSSADIDEGLSKGLDSSVSRADNASADATSRNEMLGGSKHGKYEASEVSTVDSTSAKVHPDYSITELSKDVRPFIMVKQEYRDLEKPVDKGTQALERQLLSSDVKKTVDVTDGQVNASVVPLEAACHVENLPSSLEAITDKLDACSSLDVSSTDPGVSQSEAVAEGATDSERTGKPGAYSTEVHKDCPAPLVMSGPKDKLLLESTKAKPVAGKKKKRKAILSKADAAGTSDLYNAYKSPEEKHQVANSSDDVVSSLLVDRKHLNADNPDGDAVAVEKDVESKIEFDNWEDAADMSTPKLENGKQVNEVNKHPEGDGSGATGRKYTRDFLLTFSEHCMDLPRGFNIGSDIADALMNGPPSRSHVVERDPYPSPGRTPDRSPGFSRSDSRAVGTVDDGKWIKPPVSFPLADGSQNFRPCQGANFGVPRKFRGQPSNQFAPILSGPMQSFVPQGGPVHTSSDGDRWRSNNSRGLMPPPHTPMQVMHKAEKKYEVGKVSDEEQGKQRQLKGILNKLTPQNFDRLFKQVQEVNIDNTITLSGVISQIFDKALMEPTFCEMYADFCFHLSSELPDFIENDEKITFKRLLLNKCQEEFERGEREQEEADRVEEGGEIKQCEAEREEKRIKARRRMLGNIRLIGELYKKKMLTERIMHECIKKLLGQYQNPDEEDLESLCKLMSTIGDQIDHAMAKVHMDSYFESMLRLSTNQKLSSRVRFMLRDVIDLRKNRWQQRRKVEGPKKIEEVHRDAAQERQSQASRLTRGPSINSSSRRGPSVDYGFRGSSLLPSPSFQMGGIRGLSPQVHGIDIQDVRTEARNLIDNRAPSVLLPQRPSNDSSLTLGPQGGLARRMSIRGRSLISTGPLAEPSLSTADDHRMASGPNGYSSASDRVHYSSRGDTQLRHMPGRITEQTLDTFVPASMPVEQAHGLGGSSSAAFDAKPLSEEVMREKSISAIREFYSAKDEKEISLCIEELNSPSFYPSMVSIWVTDSFERKDAERDLLASLLVNLCKSRDSLLSQVQLIQGFESVLSLLEDAVSDAPRAAEFLGRIFVRVILDNVVPLKEIAELIHEGGEEPGRLLEIGLASEVLGSMLEIIKLEKGENILREILTRSKLHLEQFRPPHPVKSKKLDAFL